MPSLRRGAHAVLSPSFGAPATPGVWQAVQVVSYTFLPSGLAAAGAAAVVATAATGVDAVAAAGLGALAAAGEAAPAAGAGVAPAAAGAGEAAGAEPPPADW